MPLKLALKPGEQFVLNGAVLANGDRRTNLVVQNKATILREKDIMQQEEVDTPAKHIYFPIMMMYLDDNGGRAYYDEFVIHMTEFMNAIQSPEAMAICVKISKLVMEREFYKALIECRKLFKFEEERLKYVPEGVPESAEINRKSA